MSPMNSFVTHSTTHCNHSTAPLIALFSSINALIFSLLFLFVVSLLLSLSVVISGTVIRLVLVPPNAMSQVLWQGETQLPVPGNHASRPSIESRHVHTIPVANVISSSGSACIKNKSISYINLNHLCALNTKLVFCFCQPVFLFGRRVLRVSFCPPFHTKQECQGRREKATMETAAVTMKLLSVNVADNNTIIQSKKK
jgi:hypothetical protein